MFLNVVIFELITVINQGDVGLEKCHNNLTAAEFKNIITKWQFMTYKEQYDKVLMKEIVLVNAILYYYVDSCVYYIVCIHNV